MENHTQAAATDPELHTLTEVLQAELVAIADRQGVEKADPTNLAGLALSGGGIRSATFSLGALQALNKRKILPVFDYLATVSGGGYVGGWWSAWLARPKTEGIFPDEEQTELSRSPYFDKTSNTKELPDSAISAGVDPIHHLRLFSNYLTPRKGLLSADTWRAITTVTRNLLLTWLVLIPLLMAAVWVGQLYFSLQRDSQIEFTFTENDPAPHYSQGFREAKADTLAKIAAFMRKTADSVRGKPAFTVLSEKLQDSLNSISKNDTLAKIAARIQKKVDSISGNPALTVLFEKLQDSLKSISKNDTLAKIAARIQKKVDSVSENPARIVLSDKLQDSLKSISKDSLAQVNDLANSYYQLRRLKFALWPILAFFGWCIVMVTAWMQSTRDSAKALRFRVLCGAPIPALLLLLALVWWIHLSGLSADDIRKYWCEHSAHILFGLIGWYVIALGMLYAVFAGVPPLPDDQSSETVKGKQRKRFSREMIRNRIVSKHTTLLVSLVLMSVVLGFAGFGAYVMHVMINETSSSGSIGKFIIKNGGIAAFLSSIAASIYTAFVASPKGGADRDKTKTSSGTQQLILAIAPPLILLILLACSSWLDAVLLRDLMAAPFCIQFWFRILGLVSLFILFCFGISEIKRAGRRRSHIEFYLGIALVVVLLVGACLISNTWQPASIDDDKVAIWFGAVMMVGGWLLLRTVNLYRNVPTSHFAMQPLHKSLEWLRNHRLLSWVLTLVVVPLLVTLLVDHLIDHAPHRASAISVALFSSTGVLALALFLFLEARIATSDTNPRPLVAFTVIYTLLIVMLFVGFFGTPDSSRLLLTSSAVTLIAIALGFVAVVGWKIDPNALSLHMFYKSRLVRAYMGASNEMRSVSQSEIYEANYNDDVRLCNLRNTVHHAPLHLIQSTLNLVAAQDLATAQRSAEPFLLSKHYCGSLRTGFRKTDAYMKGTLTLGTAVATSGAAVSPNMGSKTPSTALVMLMSFLNIRLGFWAPTPNKPNWRERQPSLWPFYVLKEFFSQTNEQTSYCYLTDGGHFDNTGLYQLIQRGCKYLLVLDDGADPGPTFGDLGNVIRRCRIDFGTEFNIDLSPLLSSAVSNSDSPAPVAQRHYVVGKVTYSEAHVKQLGWPAGSCREAILAVVKPTVTKEEKVDVLQYHHAHEDFPNQSTAQQWYDEAEFESYRKLGERSVKEMLDPAETNWAQRIVAPESQHGAIPTRAQVARLFDQLYSIGAG